MINKRLSDLSGNEEIFNKAKEPYENALKKSGYNQKLTYKINASPNNRRNRSRKILWFNPPFNANLKTNLGKQFFALLEKHFPTHHKLHKIINKNTVKLSYSCMQNIGQIIHAHNRKILREGPEQNIKTCNCRNVDECPLNGECLAENVVYQADVHETAEISNYIGISKPAFKSRYNNHANSFNDESKKSDTELSKKIWDLKEKGLPYKIHWKILEKVHSYNPGNPFCALCISEKFHILKAWGKSLLNSKSEIISKCRHKKQFSLQAVK